MLFKNKKERVIELSPKERHLKKIRKEPESILKRFGEKNPENFSLIELIMSFSKLANVDFEYSSTSIKNVNLHKVNPTTVENGVLYALFILNDRGLVNSTFEEKEIQQMLKNSVSNYNKNEIKKIEFNITDIVTEILKNIQREKDNLSSKGGVINLDYVMEEVGKVYFSKYSSSINKPSFTKILGVIALSCGYISLTEMVFELSYDIKKESEVLNIKHMM